MTDEEINELHELRAKIRAEVKPVVNVPVVISPKRKKWWEFWK